MRSLSFFIARRIVGNRQPAFSRLIIRLAAGATAVSVATMLVTLSMVNGFQHEVSSKVYNFWGHVRVQGLEPPRAVMTGESSFFSGSALEQTIKAVPGSRHLVAFAAKSVVLRTAQHFSGVVLKGVDDRFSAAPFSRFIRQGRNLSFPDSGYGNGLLISEKLARDLEAKTGDTVAVLFVRGGNDIKSRNLVICGLFSTGMEEYDQGFALADLRFLQKMNQWSPQQVGGYEVWLQQPESAKDYSALLYQALPQGLTAAPIAQLFPNIFDWLAIQNQTKKIVIGVMLAVAVINLVTCLLILVMERSRMVALLAALGMGSAGRKQIFWFYTAWICGVGIGIGVFLGLGILWLQQATGFIRMDEATYFVDRMPVKIIAWQVAAVIAGTFAVCALAMMLPLRYIQRISVAKALRFS